MVPETCLPGSVPDLSPLPSAELQAPSVLQKDPANVDYEDLFLYSNAVAEAAACPVSAPAEVCI